MPTYGVYVFASTKMRIAVEADNEDDAQEKATDICYELPGDLYVIDVIDVDVIKR